MLKEKQYNGIFKKTLVLTPILTVIHLRENSERLHILWGIKEFKNMYVDFCKEKSKNTQWGFEPGPPG